MAGDHSDDDGENEALEQHVDHFAEVHEVPKVAEISGKADADLVIVNGHQRSAHPSDHDGKNYQNWQGATDGHQSRKNQVMDRVDIHRAEGVDFLVNAHGPDLGGHGGADAAGDQYGHHDRGEFLANGVADDAADVGGEAALGQQRAGLERDNAANEERQNAGHEQAGIADLEQLVVNLLPVTPEEGQRLHCAPE